jgi:hypothetical protein
MEEEIPIPTPPLTNEEKAALKKLSQADIEFIDATIMANCFQAGEKLQWSHQKLKTLSKIVILHFPILFTVIEFRGLQKKGF